MSDMDLKQWARVLRGRWRVVLACVVVGGAVAAAYAWTRTPIYATSTQLFVATVGNTSDPAQTYQGGLFAQQRVLSYTGLVNSPSVLQRVISDLRLPLSPAALAGEITATVPQGTVLLDVSVKDRSPRRAVAIARSLDVQFPTLIKTLESSSATTGAGNSGSSNSSVDISVVAPPQLPASPVAPRKPLILALGLIIGLVAGIIIGLLREYWDQRVRDPENASEIVGAAIIGSIPEHAKARKRPLAVQDDPYSMIAEGYRQLRTNLQFGQVQKIRSLAVCSAVPAEGKTTVAANLAVALAQAGLRVILIDADLRLPGIDKLFGLDNAAGLSDALSGRPVTDLLQQHDSLPLAFIPSGRQPVNPSELLERLPDVISALESQGDIVVFDSPALLPVADGSIVARSVSAVLIVTRVRSTRVRQLEGAVRSLRLVDAHVIGVVANFVARGAGDERTYGRYGKPPADPLPPNQPGKPPADPLPPNQPVETGGQEFFFEP
jgi:succinoglycan biosynthesis transport protein ExoP